MTPPPRNTTALLLSVLVLGAVPPGAASAPLDATLWQVTLETGRFGPIETYLRLDEIDGQLRGRSLSGALDLIRTLPGAAGERVDLSDGLFGFDLQPTEAGYGGQLVAPWPGAAVTLQLDGTELSGSIEKGSFGGTFTGTRVEATRKLRDYPAVLYALDGVVRDRVFEPRDLEAAEYVEFRRQLGRIASSANDDLDLLLGFRFGWTNQPFSHFDLRRSSAPAAAMIAGFDDFRVGYEAARLEVADDVAVLTVDTMMGNDTIEQIEAAYGAIAEAEARALVIDLRGNGGGAFAVKPLIEHVIDEPLDAGYFMAHRWNVANDRPPTREELEAVEPWQGWSISAFWRTVQDDGLLRVRFEPAAPNFDGPVYVLIDGESASATELAADAFRASGLATLIGERSEGQMLSQSFFDVAEGFMVSLPVADYYSVSHGRIEGAGVPVDLEVDSAGALDRARQLAAEALR